LSRASDEYFHDNSIDVRIHIDAHLCKPECGNLGTVNQEYNKGVVYLAIYKGPLLAGIFLQNEGYDSKNADICNLCESKIQIVRKIGELNNRYCRLCEDYFYLEIVTWTTHSFTIYGNQIVRDKQLSECEKHYQPQDELFL